MVRFLLLLLSFWAAVTSAADTWRYVATPNFELYTSAGEGDARSTIEYFEQVRGFFLSATNGASATRLPVTIVAFKNPGQFKPYSPNEGTAAFYTGTQHRDYIVLSDTGSDHFPEALHEYVHLLIRHAEMRIPAWLDEGIAEVYSTLKPRGGKLLVGMPPVGRAYSLVTGKWLPIRRLLAVTHDSPDYNEKDRAGIFYAQSWALAHMLMLDPKWKPEFWHFVAALGAGETAESAFQKIWGASLDQVDKTLQGYVRSQSLTGALFDTKFQKVTGLEVRVADPDETEIVLATVAALAGKTEGATKRLEAVAARRASDPRPQESLGMTAVRAGDRGKALWHYRRAAELGSKNWSAWWDYGLLLNAAPKRDLAAMEDAFAKAVELNRSYLPARLMLASVYNEGRKPGSALAVLQSVKQVKPADAPGLFIELAYAHAQLNRPEEAQKALDRARQFAKEPRDRSRVESLGRYLEATAAARTQGAVASAPAAKLETPSAEEAEEHRLSVSGVFQELDCTVEPPRFVVATASGVVRLAIADPASITVDGSNRERPLTCGAQAGKRKVKVDYVPTAGRDVKGKLRAITFE